MFETGGLGMHFAIELFGQKAMNNGFCATAAYFILTIKIRYHRKFFNGWKNEMIACWMATSSQCPDDLINITNIDIVTH